MDLTDLIAIAFWPVLCGLALISWKLRRGQRNFVLNIVGVLGFGALLAWTLFGFVSLTVVFDLYVGIILIGLLFGYSLFYEWNTASTLRKFAYGTFCIGPFAFGSWFLVGDYLLPREIVQGRIEALYRETSSKGPDSFKMQVNRRGYNVTTRVFDTLRVGDDIRAEIGRASRYAYRVDSYRVDAMPLSQEHRIEWLLPPQDRPDP